MGDADDESRETRRDVPQTRVAPRDDTTELELDPLIETIAERQRSRYRSEGVIARGGMGMIEPAHDRSLDRRIVLKRIRESLRSDQKTVQMFVREARLTGQLEHPCIVPVHELGVDDHHVYFAMKLVEGRTLEQWLSSLPPGPLDRSTLFDLLEVIVRVCDALSYAHARGFVHCDIKPANVMVGDFGQVYLMDWGIARSVHDSPPAPNYIVGTASHMPPEQARSGAIDVRADVFGVGTLLYHIITREPPYRAETHILTLAAAYKCSYPPPDEMPYAYGTPPALVRIVLQAMSESRADRYQSVADLRDALVRFMRGVDAFPRVRFEAGEAIVCEGELGSEAYVIESGKCDVHRTVNGERTWIREMGAGEVFGEMAILAPGPRTATVTAIEPTTLLQITAATLQAEIDSMKPWMGALVRTLAERFRQRETPR